MYSYQKIEHDNEDDTGEPRDVDDLHEEWQILDPDGVELAIVFSEVEAEVLISHLNR